MFKKRRTREEARLQAQLADLRTSITADLLGQMRDMLSLQPVSPTGQPKLSELAMAVHDLPAAHLSLKFFGYELARSLAAGLPVRETAERHVGLASKLSTQADMATDWVEHWCRELQVARIFHRKLWELAYVLQAFAENGHLVAGARGLGFGCGEEPIASYLASRGVAVTVTDLDADRAQAAGWADTGQHAASLEKAFHPHLVERESFDHLVTHRIADMNAIPTELRGYDFCWSVCALEHLGSIAQGMRFIEASLETLRPGGVAVHTTEFNINSDGATIDNWPTVLFQRRHFEELAVRLRAAGHDVAPFDWDLGDGPMDRFIDLPPWGHDLPAEFAKWHGEGAHLKLGLDGFVSTCVGIVIRKA
jgi:SAM-dependent methyltransferase